MELYYIYEKEHLNSIREPSFTYKGTLANAKRFATRSQFFQGTVLVIEDFAGTVSYKLADMTGWRDIRR